MGKMEVKCGDRIRADGKTIVVHSKTSTTFFGINGDHIHFKPAYAEDEDYQEDIEIVKKADVLNKDTIDELEKGDTIRGDHFIGIAHKISKVEENKFSIVYIPLNELGKVGEDYCYLRVEKDLSLYNGEKVEIIKNPMKNTLDSFA